jgi:hypothetical protein
MDAAKIEAKIQRGNGISAKILGGVYDQYRPFTTDAVMSNTNYLGIMNARFDPDFRFGARKPNLYGHPLWGVLADRTLMKVGDYLDGPEGTFFIVTMQGLLPTAAVSCNTTVTVSRPVAASPGPDYYGGNQTLLPIITSWPASVLQGTKGERGNLNLPGDVRLPWKQILLPSFPGVQILFGDAIVDNQTAPIGYTVSGAELTDTGWRLSVAQTTA